MHVMQINVLGYTGGDIFTAQRNSSMVYAVVVFLSVCPCPYDDL